MIIIFKGSAETEMIKIKGLHWSPHRSDAYKHKNNFKYQLLTPLLYNQFSMQMIFPFVANEFIYCVCLPSQIIIIIIGLKPLSHNCFLIEKWVDVHKEHSR